MASTPPQPILDSLSTVQADADATAAAATTQATAGQALAQAQHDKDQADSAVVAATAKQAGDVAALHTLIDQTYGPAPAAPTTPPTATPAAGS